MSFLDLVFAVVAAAFAQYCVSLGVNGRLLRRRRVASRWSRGDQRSPRTVRPRLSSRLRSFRSRCVRSIAATFFDRETDCQSISTPTFDLGDDMGAIPGRRDTPFSR